MTRKFLLAFLCAASASAADVHFLVMPEEIVGPISPYIYGLNAVDPGDTRATLRRLGGNRLTGYNWETNASNAGSDWHQTSDNWLCGQALHYSDCDQPGALVRDFVAENQKLGMDSLVTVPMAGYVAADEKGEVLESETAPSSRWDKVVFRKKGPFTLTPDLKDQVVYDDEFVNFLVSNFKKASEGGIKFYDLDNEPSLWPSTHPRIHPPKTGYREMVDKTEQLAFAILKVDPTAQILGPVSYGWQGFLTLQNAPEGTDLNQQYGSFLDFYLSQMRSLQKRDGERLLHALDLHWYPEAQGGGNPSTGLGAKRITEGDTSPDSVEARLQAPRSLWDPGYVEKSWITQSTGGKPIALIPWVQQKIDKDYPGTKMAFSEYDYGAGDHISGGLAQADALGVFGKYGVYLANYWGDLKAYNKAAFKLYRNYDGKGSAFGDTEVSAATEDVTQSSCYAAVDPQNPGTLWIVAINKNQKDPIGGKFRVQGKTPYKTYAAYGFDSSSAEVRPLKTGNFDGDHFDYSLPPLSATLWVCR